MKLFKKALVSITLLTAVITPITAFADSEEVKVKVDGNLVNFPDAQPYIDESNNRTMVPARFVSEALGYQVFWNEAQRKVVITKTINGKGVIVTLKEGENKAEVDGKIVTFDASAVIKNDRTFVPLRFVSESFGATVQWDEAQRLVTITTGNETGTGGGTTPSPGTGIGEVIVKDPANPNWLLPPSPETQPAVEEFLASLKLGNGVLTGKIPKIPDGYKYVVDFTDKDIIGGDPNKRQTITKLASGQTFTINVGDGGQLSFALSDQTGAIRNGVYVQIPEMTAEWSAKR